MWEHPGTGSCHEFPATAVLIEKTVSMAENSQRLEMVEQKVFVVPDLTIKDLLGAIPYARFSSDCRAYVIAEIHILPAHIASNAQRSSLGLICTCFLLFHVLQRLTTHLQYL